MRPGVRSLTIASDFWERLVAALPDGLAVVNGAGEHVAANDAFCTLTGCDATVLARSGLPPAYCQTDAEASAFRAAFHRALAGETASLEMPLRGGCIGFFQLSPLEEGGTAKSAYVVISAHDITTRKQTELELSRSEERWRSVAENPFDFVVIIDREYRYAYVNHTIPGLTQADVLGKKTPFDFVAPRDHEAMREAFERAFRDGRPQSYEVYVEQLRTWFSTIVGPIVENGVVTSLSLLTRDITDARLATEAALQSEHRLQLALAGANVGSFDVELETGAAVYSAQSYVLLGYEPGDPRLERTLDGFAARQHPDEREPTMTAFREAAQGGGSFDREFRLRVATGEYRWFHGRGKKFSDPGRGARFIGFMTDITARHRAEDERQKLEVRMRHTQRLETLGTLASGIAHDFNNALVPIVGCAELLLGEIDPSSPIREDVEIIAVAAARARELVSRILTFSRRAEERREAVHVPDLVREVVKLLRSSVPMTVDLRTRLDETLPSIHGDPAQLHQLITNLCTNACQAVGSASGVVQLTVEVTDVSPQLSARLLISEGRAVTVSVEDDGPGMSADVIERAFDPFFTTKPPGQGTGLGLAIAHAVVTSHGGAIDVLSSPGRGALFRVYLPVGPQASAPTAPPPPMMHSTRPARILLVDDDHIVLRTWSRVLTAEGHIVTAVRSAEEALARMAACSEPFELLVTDHTMPGMTGLGLIRRLAELAPSLPVVLVSGLGEDALSGPRPPNLHAVLSKPATPSELSESVRRALLPVKQDG